MARLVQPPGIYHHPAKLRLMAAEAYVSFKRTLHPARPLPRNKHSRRYPHHYQHPVEEESPNNYRLSSTTSTFTFKQNSSTRSSSSYLSKFLILLFLSICDNWASTRTLTLAEAAAASVEYGSSTSSTTVPILTSSSSSSSTSSSTSSRNSLSDSESDDVTTTTPSSSVTFNQTKLQEIIMEGLGLSEIPDVRLMNVSQQEYETKYREYLERVNRRNGLQRRLLGQQSQNETDDDDAYYANGLGDDGHDATDEEELFETRHLYSFPNSGHQLNHQNLRRKRSLNNDYDLVYIRFDIPTRNSTTGELPDLSSPSLVSGAGGHHHNNHHHQRHHQTLSELPPISPENIEESSLNIMLTRRQNSERSTNMNGKHQQQQPPSSGDDQQRQHHPPPHHGRRKGRIKFKHNNPKNGEGSSHRTSKSVNLYIYQLVEPYERHLLTSKTIGVSEIALNDKKWFQLPLGEAVRTWLDGSRKNLGLEIYCENCYNNDIFVIHNSSPYFGSYEETPILNVVGKLVQREKRSKIQHFPIRDYTSPPKFVSCKTNNKRCCRHPLLVDIRDIEGYEFIIQPKLFDAGICRGRCPYKFNPASHHALLQSLLHEHVKYDVPKPCCAPSRLDHIDFLHADPKNPERLKVSTWTNMRVMECACS